MKFRVRALLLIATATPGLADSGEISMVGVGLPLSPESPTPLPPTHPLFHDIQISEIDQLPATIKSSSLNWIAAAKRSSINAALLETFRRLNFLDPEASAGRKRLSVSWIGSRTPFHIGTSNTTTVTLRYRLTRVDSGQVLFDREISTSVVGGGLNASMRDNEIVRAAIATNFASAANCLDRAAFGTTPADCALKPKFSVAMSETAASFYDCTGSETAQPPNKRKLKRRSAKADLGKPPTYRPAASLHISDRQIMRRRPSL